MAEYSHDVGMVNLKEIPRPSSSYPGLSMCICYSVVTGIAEELEEQQRGITIPSEEEFAGRVRGVEQDRAQATSHINDQLEEVDIREKDIERIRVSPRLHSEPLKEAFGCSSISTEVLLMWS